MKSPSEQKAPSEPVVSKFKRTKTRALCSKSSRARALGASLLALSHISCSCEDETDPPEITKPEPQLVEETEAPVAEGDMELALLSQKSRCTLHQDGLVLDMGSPATEARRMFRLIQEVPPEFTTREGHAFRKFDQMGTDFAFWLTEDLKEFDFTARVHGTASERMAVYVDGKRLGAASLREGVTRQVRISGRDMVLEKGRHKLTLSLSRPRGSTPKAEIGWVRLGPKDKVDSAPATRQETFSEVTIEGERQASVVLRPSASLRCPVWIPPETLFEANVGVWGEGPAETEIVVHTKNGRRIVVAAEARKDDDSRKFTKIEADLSQFASQFVDLELSAPRTLKRARVAIGNPTIKSKTSTGGVRGTAQRAIVVVLSGIGERHAPPASAESGAPFLSQLAKDAAHFTNYRTSTTSVPGVMASLFTGLEPWAHGVQKFSDQLSAKKITLAGAIEAQGGRSSFFTGVPLSFEPLGLARGFEKFAQTGPQEDKAAVEPLEQAQSWLEARLNHEGPVLSVIHLRGAHPPFDVPKDGAVDLAPSEYGGDLSPRRAAIQLAEIRARRSGRHRRMPDEDWVRLLALEKAALLKQSTALSEFVDWLRKKDAYDDTLLVVVGDVGPGDRPTIPYATRSPLVEPALAPPLLVKFPGGYLAGEKRSGFFAPRDLTTTIFAALGLDSNEQISGIDLAAAQATSSAELRPHVAYRDGAYAMRLGSHLLRGEDGSAPTLCQLALDPTCQEDRADGQILETRALWYAAWNALAPSLSKPVEQPPEQEEPEEGESFFDNALTVWGVDR